VKGVKFLRHLKGTPVAESAKPRQLAIHID